MRRILVLLAAFLCVAGSAEAQIVRNNSTATSEDSLTIPFWLADSLGQPTSIDTTGADSAWIVFCYPGGDTAFSDEIRLARVEPGIRLSIPVPGGGVRGVQYRRKVSDIDGTGVNGVYTWTIYARDSSLKLWTPFRGSFQVYVSTTHTFATNQDSVSRSIAWETLDTLKTYDTQGVNADVIQWRNVAPLAPTTDGTIIADLDSASAAGGAGSVSAVELVDAAWDELLTGATHNIATSAGRRLRALASTVMLSGTADSGSVDGISLAGGSATNGLYVGCLVVIDAGAGAGQSRYIVSYRGANTMARVARHWTTAPDNTSTFNIYADNQLMFITLDTARAAGASTITLNTTASATNDIYNGCTIRILAGTGDDQVRLITDYDGTTKVCTVTPAWTAQPNSYSAYGVMTFGPASADGLPGDLATKITNVYNTAKFDSTQDSVTRATALATYTTAKYDSTMDSLTKAYVLNVYNTVKFDSTMDSLAKAYALNIYNTVKFDSTMDSLAKAYILNVYTTVKQDSTQDSTNGALATAIKVKTDQLTFTKTNRVDATLAGDTLNRIAADTKAMRDSGQYYAQTGSAGSGAQALTVTALDTSGTAAVVVSANVDVHNIGQTTRLWGTLSTNTSGTVTGNNNVSTQIAIVAWLPGFVFPVFKDTTGAGTTFADTVRGYNIAIGNPAVASLKRVYGYEYNGADTLQGLQITASLISPPATGDSVVIDTVSKVNYSVSMEIGNKSDVNGYWFVDLPLNSNVRPAGTRWKITCYGENGAVRWSAVVNLTTTATDCIGHIANGIACP